MPYGSQPGFAALLTIIIIGAATLILSFGTFVLSIGDFEQGYVVQQGSETLAVADGCIDEAMRRLRTDETFGSGGVVNLTIGDGSCTITVSTPQAGKRTIVVLGTIGNYNRKIEVTISLASNVATVDSWVEKTD
jgi:hypothetical protein